MNDVPNQDVENSYVIHHLPEKPESWCIKLIDTEWDGVILTYGKIDVKEDNENFIFKFDYDILYVPDELRKKEMPDEKKLEFETMLGKIAVNIIHKNEGKLTPSGTLPLEEQEH